MNGPPSSGRIRQIVRWLLVAVAAGAALVALQGRVVQRIGTVRIFSSRGPEIPSVIAVAACLAFWLALTRDERRRARRATSAIVAAAATRLARAGAPVFAGVARIPDQIAPALAALVAIAVVIVSLTKGAPVAGGADAYGYVSQADLWARGNLHIEQPFVRDLHWPFVESAFAPLGYRAVRSSTTIVPQYSPGLPMLMALFELAAGRPAVFYVVPLLGGFAVWMTYIMGARLAGRGVGVAAAVLLATSPPFLIQLMAPVSDVPATAWWAAMLALLLFDGPMAALAAGLAAGAAILTRPNLVPLAGIPGLMLLARAVHERTLTGPASRRALVFAAGVIPACVAVAVINTRLYGSPLATGYPTFGEMFGTDNLLPNLARYPRWMLDTETPLVLTAFAGPLLVRRIATSSAGSAHRARATARMWLAFAAAVFLCYLFYVPFDGWFWLRFVLPAFPALLALVAVTIAGLTVRFARGARVTIAALFVGVLAWHGWSFAASRQVFDTRPGERRYVDLGRYIVERLPERAVFVSVQHSGSIRYYADRLTVRFDVIPPNRLDTAIDELRAHGYHPYIVLEDWEEPGFQMHFRGHSDLAALDWPPVAAMDDVSHVRIYDPADRSLPPAARRATEMIR